jgi:hypothetical protein
VAFLLPDNVAQDVDAGKLAWTAPEDGGARVKSCTFGDVQLKTRSVLFCGFRCGSFKRPTRLNSNA